MDIRHKSEILSYLLSLAIFSAFYAVLYYLYRFVFGFEKSASGVIIIFMASLCVTDYVNYYRKRKKDNDGSDQKVNIERRREGPFQLFKTPLAQIKSQEPARGAG